MEEVYENQSSVGLYKSKKIQYLPEHDTDDSTVIIF